MSDYFWSWQALLTSVTLQCCGIAFVYHRNTYVDRHAIVLLLPIVCTELLQILMFAFSIIEDCNVVNEILTHVIMLLICMFPVIQIRFAFKTSFFNDLNLNDCRRRLTLKLSLYLYYLWFFIVIGIRVYNELISRQSENSNNSSSKICIYSGKDGHQNWSHIIHIDFGSAQHSIVWHIFIFITNLLYLLPNILLLLLYRPLWLILIHALCTLMSFCTLWILYSDETFELWSMVSVFNFAWILMAPHIIHCLIKFDMISYHNSNILLNGSHGHFTQYHMLESQFALTFSGSEYEYEDYDDDEEEEDEADNQGEDEDEDEDEEDNDGSGFDYDEYEEEEDADDAQSPSSMHASVEVLELFGTATNTDSVMTTNTNTSVTIGGQQPQSNQGQLNLAQEQDGYVEYEYSNSQQQSQTTTTQTNA